MENHTLIGALKRLDWSLFIATFLLAALGLSALYSVTINVDDPDYTQLTRQIIFAVIGIIILLVCAQFDYRLWWSSGWLSFFLGVVLLLGVLLFGETIRGTKGWFVIFGQSFQPIEFVRIFYLLFLARYFTTRMQSDSTLRTIVVSGLLTMIFIVLLILQPEFGYAAVLAAIWLIFILFLKIPRWQVGLVIVLLIAVSAVSWFYILEDYQKDRFIAYLNPSNDQLGRSYNVTQSIVAIGSGQLFGRGLGLGPQSQLNFLPEQSTDFIFAVIAEELGFLGTCLILGLFILIFARLYRAIRISNDTYATLLLSAILMMLFIQMSVNIGMNLGLLPITGIPLPFVSHGGSAIISNFALIGIAQSFLIRQYRLNK
ncbi:MAG: FtsW/RodA/SpoVE family cell cycle protein [bacterium]